MSIADDLDKIKRLHVEQASANVLIVDIETSPSLAYVWSLWQENVPLDRLQVPGEVICFAAQWYGQEEIMFFSNYHDGHDAMINSAWDLYNSADVVITYNGDSFDNKHLNREFILAGLTPPSPYKSIDLYKIVRQLFKFQSNKLDFVAQQLKVGAKVKHPGFQMWQHVMTGTPEEKAVAWEQFKTYNCGDTKITGDVYTKVRPWIKNHPVVWSGGGDGELVCARCGSSNITKTGVDNTATFEYPRYICLECGGWDKGSESTRIQNLKTI